MMNGSISIIFSSLDVIIRFIVKFFLVWNLSQKYVGMNDTFTSAVAMLSLAELGIGPAIVCALYKPIAQKNEMQIKALMKLYKKIYNYIGCSVGGLGLLLIPFLPNLLKGQRISEKIYVIYLLFLVNAMISYFFTSNRSLVQAHQMNYYVVINDVDSRRLVMLCKFWF